MVNERVVRPQQASRIVIVSKFVKRESLYVPLLSATLFTLVAALVALVFYQILTAPLILAALVTPSTIIALIKILMELRIQMGRKTAKVDAGIVDESNLSDLISRLASSIKTARITTYEIVKNYRKSVKTILFMKFRETKYGQTQVVLKDRLKKLGFKFIWGGVWILPPKKTPQDLESQDDLQLWIDNNIMRGVDPKLKYVLPFATILDLRSVFAKREGKPDEFGPSGRVKTLFEELGADDFDSHVVYSCIKKRHVSIEDLIRQGDIVFLASKSVDTQTRWKLERSKEKISEELKTATGAKRLDLSYFSSMGPKGEGKLAAALERHVSDPKAVSKDIIDEAKFWDNFLRDRTRSALLRAGPPSTSTAA